MTTSAYHFCAPVTGKYFLNGIVRIDTVDTAASYYRIKLVTSNRTIYGDLHDVGNMFSSDASYHHLQVTSLVDITNLKGDKTWLI